jgi:trehalose 6-phosphate phosphatase
MKSPRSAIWAFDFDGTLSHLVPDRDSAALDPACEDLLADLADDKGQVVAVVSSRSLEDLKLRIRINNVVLAGGSGLEWLVPGGQWLGPNHQTVERLHAERQRLLPALAEVGQIQGVEIEDKTWSAAVHFRGVPAKERVLVARKLEDLNIRHGVSLHYGPDVAEVQFLQEVSKELAMKTLVTLFSASRNTRKLVYAGDDQNDAQAMRWVMDKGGTVFIVGNRISLAGAYVVPDPTALARAIRRRFKLIATKAGRQNKGVMDE